MEKERFGIFDDKSIPYLEDQIAKIKDTLEKDIDVIDEKGVAHLKSRLSAYEEQLNHLRAKQK